MYQNLTSPQGKLNLNFLKKSREKLYDYLLITYMKKFNGRSLTGSNLGNTGECKIFGSLRKSSNVFRNLRKISESSQNYLTTIFENFRKCSEMLGKLREPSENFRM